jgi:competence protein ComEA
MTQKRAVRRRPLLAILLCCGFVFTVSCVKLSQPATDSLASTGQNATPASPQTDSSEPLVNINTATAVELERLPGIGPVLAGRIVEHRERYGRFRRPEHLIIVRGMSDARFREMRGLITVE